MDARVRNVSARLGTAGRRTWLAALVTVLVGWASASTGSGHLLDLEAVVADAAARSGLSLKLHPGPCVGLERISSRRDYCVRHAMTVDAPVWGADLGLRRWVAAGALARSLETHPRLVSVTTYPSESWREAWAVFVLEYPEGLLDVRVSPTRPYQAAATFRPRDPIGPCLRAYDMAVDPFELARAFHTFDAALARTLLACVEDTGQVDSGGRTALFEAVSASDAVAVRAFLAAGWRHDRRDDGGWTPLLLAARDATDPAVLIELMAAGADPTIGPSGARWRDALWQARRNDHLAGSEVLIGLIADYVRRTAVRSDPGHEPREVTRGTAPFLPPTAAPTDVEAVLLTGSMTLRGVATATTGDSGDVVDVVEGLDLQIDFELVRWTLPLVLDGTPYLVAVTYTQSLEVTAYGDGELFDGLVPDASEDFWFELVDVSDGTWGATRFAIADDLDSPSVGAALDLVPLRGLLVGAGARVPPDARVGVGAEWVTERRIDLKGSEIVFERRESVADIGEAAYTIDVNESVVLPGFTQRDGWIETVISLRQEMAYRTTLRPSGRVRALTHGDVGIEQTLSMRAGRDQVEVSITLSGPFEATLVAVDWEALTAETRRGIVQRIVRLLTRNL